MGENLTTDTEITTAEKQLAEGTFPSENKKENTVTHTENIDVTEKIESTASTRLDFMNEDNVNDFIKTKTKVAADTIEPKKPHPSAEQIEAGELAESNKLTDDDLEMVAEFIITLIDTFIPNLLRYWSKDTSDKAYSLPENKKKILIRQLTWILIKKKSKFKIEIIFIIGLVMFYIPAFMKARDTRKENKKLAIEEANTIATQEVIVKETEIPAYIIKDDVKTGETVYTPINLSETVPPAEKNNAIKKPTPKINKFPKRRPGGQKR